MSSRCVESEQDALHHFLRINPKSGKFLGYVNGLFPEVTSHGLRVEAFRHMLVDNLAAKLGVSPTTLRSILIPCPGDLFLHDIGKIMMGATLELSLQLLRPEKYGLTKTTQVGQTDNRPDDVRGRYLMHPELGMLAIWYLASHGILDSQFSVRASKTAVRHHERTRLTPHLVSYPRACYRTLLTDISPNIFEQVSDIAAGIGTELREYRNGLVPERTQSKIFVAQLPISLMTIISNELLRGGVRQTLSPIELRHVLIDSIFQTQREVGKVNPSDPVPYIDPTPKRSSRTFEKLPGIIWSNNRQRLDQSAAVFSKRLEQGVYEDKLRHIH